MQINKQVVALPYKKYGLKVYESGINFLVDIPELGAIISYNGLSFSIRLPYSRFGNNTKGQCGEPRAPTPARLWVSCSSAWGHSLGFGLCGVPTAAGLTWSVPSGPVEVVWGRGWDSLATVAWSGSIVAFLWHRYLYQQHG